MSKKDYQQRDDGRFGTVTYKGIEQRYSRYDESKWNDFRNQGDEGEEDYFAGGWETRDVHERETAAYEKAKKEYERRQKNKAQRDANTAGVAANKKAIGDKAANAPKPKGDQQIDAVKESPEISAARQVVNSYQSGLKDQKSPWEQAQADANSSSFGAQNQTDFTAQFNPSGSDDTPQMSQETTDMKNKAQDFADKYKLDLISSGATKNQFGS